MTKRAVLAGSVLAGVVLWAAVYAAPLPNRGSPHPGATQGESPPPLAEEPSAPTRWVDLPGATAKPPTTPPAELGAPSAASAEAIGGSPPDRRARRHGFHRIQAAAHPDFPSATRLIGPRADRPHFVRARRRLRRIPEPIQFSLATRSSS